MQVSSLRLGLVFTVNNNIKKKFDNDGFSWWGNDVKAFITLARDSHSQPLLLFSGYLAAPNRAVLRALFMSTEGIFRGQIPNKIFYSFKGFFVQE